MEFKFKFFVLKARSLSLLPFNKSATLSEKRIGPHNQNVLSVLIGSLLGDGHMEKDLYGSRFAFAKGKKNGEYLLWLHRRLYQLGYCKSDIPQISSRFDSKMELRYYYRFTTFTYSSFNWIYDGFYCKNKKILPFFIEEYLTEEALAIWMMDDGILQPNKGFRFCNPNFSLTECQLLQHLLKEKYGLKTTLHKISQTVPQQYNIYVIKSSFLILKKIVFPYFDKSMLYKLAI